MEFLIQSLANIFLWATTICFVFLSSRSIYKGFCFYFCCLLLCVFLGFQRPIFLEIYLVPVLLLAFVPSKYYVKTEYYKKLLFLLAYVFVISVLHWRNPCPEGSYVFYGLVLVMTIRGLLITEKRQYTFVLLLWCYCCTHMLWYVMHSPSVFSLNLESRILEVDSALLESQEDYRGGIDPNYFGYLMGAGAFLSTLLFTYFATLKEVFHLRIRNSIGKLFFLFVALFQFFLSLKGLSRGVFISNIITFGVLIFVIRRTKAKARGKRLLMLLLTVALVVLNLGVYDAILGRFVSSESASRQLLALIVIYALYTWGGIRGFIFGGGTDFPWYRYAVGEYRYYNFYSTHNSWLDLMISYGVVWLIVFLICILFRLKNHYLNRNNPLSVIKIVMFTFVFVIGMSLEPLRSQLGWWIIAFCFV